METRLPTTTYLLTGAALLILLAVSAVTASFDLRPWNTPILVGVSIVQCLLILMFDMHVWYSRRSIWVLAFGGFVWLGIFFVLSFSDFLTRNYLGIPGK